MTTPHDGLSICVYCGSRPGIDPIHLEAARVVGHWIGARGAQLVYGGGRTGLMGAVADAAKEAGARVVGVIPQALVDKELANGACDELHVVSTMHERKAMMGERAGAFLALAGGIGTFEELFEIWTWRQLGYHDKPIGILNTARYFDRLLAFLDQSVQDGFMNPWQMGLVRTDDQVDALCAWLARHAGPTQPPGTLADRI
ncbi:MAG: TIGR00730 family Rossman fold protein [Comamonadaceae bacterium]|nr:MAG: TIGR00730 family Rossman fold protein [Comamonadaceae bacterium]